jgi:hypothetical protein
MFRRTPPRVLAAWAAVIVGIILVVWLVPAGSPLALAIIAACTVFTTISSIRRRRARAAAHR